MTIPNLRSLCPGTCDSGIFFWCYPTRKMNEFGWKKGTIEQKETKNKSCNPSIFGCLGLSRFRTNKRLGCVCVSLFSFFLCFELPWNWTSQSKTAWYNCCFVYCHFFQTSNHRKSKQQRVAWNTHSRLEAVDSCSNTLGISSKVGVLEKFVEGGRRNLPIQNYHIMHRING